MEPMFAAVGRHQSTGTGVALSLGLHVTVCVVAVAMVGAPAATPPATSRSSITFLTIAGPTPGIVMPTTGVIRPSAARARVQPPSPAKAVADTTRAENKPLPLPVEMPTPVDPPPLEAMRTEAVAPRAPLAPPGDSRPAPAQPVVGLFDTARGAVRNQAETAVAPVHLAGFERQEPRQGIRTAHSMADLRPAGFDVRSSPPQPADVARREPIDLPVEITFKPAPDYTDEARALKVEGSVRLEVVFLPSGDVRVLRVLDGLGHGLDEAATRAAERIRFRPARSGGAAVELRTTLHITFRLS